MYSYIDLGNEGKRIKIVPFILQYQIEKFDVSPVQEVEFSIFYPSAAVEAPSIEILSLNSKRLSSCSVLPAASVQLAPSVTSQRDTSGLPANRTLYVNCSSGEWLCKELRCSAGPFVESFAAAYLQIFLQLDITAIEPKLGRKDNIVFSTAAIITGMDNVSCSPPTKVQDVRDGLVLTCAPNWKVLDDSPNQEKFRLFGTCYQTKADNLNSFVNVTPFANDLMNLAKRQGKTVQPYFLYGEAGFSAHY
ncbi:hypothetical protein B566_EDAN014651, partial [Ephemera danica]